MTHPHGREPIGVAQDVRGQGGIEYPLVNPSADIKQLIADLWLGFVDDGYRYPFSIKWLYGFGTDPAVSPITPVHTHELEIVDADGRTVFSTQNVPGGQFQSTAWDSRLAVLQWWDGEQVLRVAYHTDWSPDDTPQTYPEYFEPVRAVLVERAVCPLPRRLVGFRVGNQLVQADRVTFTAGYNARWSPDATVLTDGTFRDNPLTLDMTPGLGLGRFGDGCDELVDPPIRSINRVGGDARGNLLLDATGCFRVTRPVHSVLDDANHELRLRDYALLLSSDCAPCCTCDDYIAVWEAMRRVRDMCADLVLRTQEARDLYHANRERFLQQQECRDQDRLRLRLQPICPNQVSVAAGYCNNTGECLTGVVLHISFDYEDASGCKGPDGQALKVESTIASSVVCDSGVRGGNTDPAQLMSGGGFSRRQQEPYQLGGVWPHYWVWFDLVDPGSTAYVTFRLTFGSGTASDRLAAIVDAYHTGGYTAVGPSPVPGYTPGSGPTTPEAMAMRLAPCPKFAATGILLDCCESGGGDGGGGGGFDPDDFAPAIHTHAIDDVVGLSLSLANIYDALDNIDAGPHTHVIDDVVGLSLSLANLDEGLDGLSDLLSQLDAGLLLLAGEVAGKADAVHPHTISDVDELSLSLASLEADIDELYGELAGKADWPHGHTIDEIDALSLSLAAIDDDIGGLGASLDLLAQDILDLAGVVSGKADTGHGHSISDVSGLQTALDGKASSAHGHAIADVTGLQTALDDLDAALAAALTKAVDTVTSSGSLTTANRTVLCNNSAAITLDLPAAASMAGDYLIVKKISANAHTVTLDPSGSETIDGATTYVLYVVGDYVVIQSDGSNWRVIGGYLTPHSCLIIRAAQQTGIPHGTQTKILYDTVSEDSAALADISNSRVVIRRTSNYLVHCYAFILAGGNNLQFVDSYLRKNSAQLVSKRAQCRSTSNLNTDALAIYRGPLSAGDVLEGTALHFAGIGTTKDTDNNTVCYLSVQELR